MEGWRLRGGGCLGAASLAPDHPAHREVGPAPWSAAAAPGGLLPSPCSGSARRSPGGLPPAPLPHPPSRSGDPRPGSPVRGMGPAETRARRWEPGRGRALGKEMETLLLPLSPAPAPAPVRRAGMCPHPVVLSQARAAALGAGLQQQEPLLHPLLAPSQPYSSRRGYQLE